MRDRSRGPASRLATEVRRWPNANCRMSQITGSTASNITQFSWFPMFTPQSSSTPHASVSGVRSNRAIRRTLPVSTSGASSSSSRTERRVHKVVLCISSSATRISCIGSTHRGEFRSCNHWPIGNITCAITPCEICLGITSRLAIAFKAAALNVIPPAAFECHQKP